MKYVLKSKFSQRAKQASSPKCGIWTEEQENLMEKSLVQRRCGEGSTNTREEYQDAC
jgi:hypothetical protein